MTASPEDMILSKFIVGLFLTGLGLFLIMWIIGGCMCSWERKHNQTGVDSCPVKEKS